MAMPISTTILSTLLLLAVAEASSLAKRDVTVKLEPPSEDPSVIGPEPECCLSKMVGPYNYTRVYIGHVPDTCISNCIYTRVGAPGSRFCFATGPQEVHCLDEGDRTTYPTIPTTADPTTEAPTTADPTTADPATAGPTTAAPTTTAPTTADPTTADPTTADTTTAATTTAAPTSPGDTPTTTTRGTPSTPTVPTTTTIPPIRTPLTFGEDNQTLTQENNYFESTGTLEVVVPPHSKYPETRYLVSEAGVLLNTNSSCQLSPAPSNLSQGVIGLPVPPSVLANTTKDRILYSMKISHTRITARGRKALEEYRTECAGQSITMTDDEPVSEEEFKTLQEGKVSVVNKTISKRGCKEAHACTSKGPQACGNTGWINPATKRGFTFHQVSDKVLCLDCKLGVPGPQDNCRRDLCWCKDITDKRSWQDCYMKSKILTLTVPGGQPSGRARRAAPTLTQTMTYSADQVEKSFRLVVPQHRAAGRTFDPLTVVMHSCTSGYWQCGGKDNMMFKMGGRCSVKTLPSGFYPFDGAVGMNEINETLTEADTKIQHSILLDAGKVDMSGLAQSIQNECSAESSTRRVKEESLNSEQVSNLTVGGVAFIQGASTRGCNVMTAVTKKSKSQCWYWPNPGTGEHVALHNVILDIEELKCCVNTPGAPGPCCSTQHPDLCLCEDINTKQDFQKCFDGPDVLLVAAGAPSATDYYSNHIQFYERNPVTGVYSYTKSNDCNPNGLPQSSTLGVGAVVTGVPEKTILFCEGYTAANTGKCYKFKQGEGFEEWTAAQPGSLNNAAHSVLTELDAWGLVWWIFTAATGGTLNTALIKLDGTSTPGPNVPEALNVVCVLDIEKVGIFLSGIPTTGAGSKGNKNWLYITDTDGGSWKPMPESKEIRLGGSCGVFHLDTSLTIVMAGGFLDTTTSEKFDLTKWLENEASTIWVAGPDVGEARYGARMVSMRQENELVLVGGISKSNEVFASIKVFAASSDAWVDKGSLKHAVYDSTALAVPKTMLRDCI